MITKAFVYKEIEEQLLAYDFNCDRILIQCGGTKCKDCCLNSDENHFEDCLDNQRALAKKIKRKLLLKKLLND